PLSDKLAALFGTLLGLVLSYLILFPPITVMRSKLPIETLLLIIALVLVPTLYICLRIMLGVKEELSKLFPKLIRARVISAESHGERDNYELLHPKVLDTSVIIDGRLSGIIASGFLEGKLLIPDFVLQELQRIRDSEDPVKRARGKRGLQMLDELKRTYPHRIEVVEEYSTAVERGPSVDSKLIRLAEELNAAIITNDDGLQRIARLHKLPVLNVNVLASALKFVVLPGEELDVYLVREGTQPGQGVGYLDDGTMVVVEGGRRYVGKRVRTMVRNVSQTHSGKMIFAEFTQELPEEEGDLFDEGDSRSSRSRSGKQDGLGAQ
ncbi:MAG: PIN domain-containing protein, partial [Armatimonadetes bacterium]|nr:PIN domain-containing protein [Armatimonadota bacterium]